MRAFVRAVQPRASSIRRFSSETPAAGDVDAPVKMPRSKLVMPGKAGKYASGLLRFAVANNADLHAVSDELEAFTLAMAKSESLREKMARPVLFFDQEKKERVLDKLFPKIGIKTAVAQDFIKMLIQENDLSSLRYIRSDFKTLVADELQEVEGIITSADPLNEEQVNRIIEGMEQFVPEGWSLSVETKVDPSLLGGFTITVGEEYKDLSVAKQISELEAHLLTGPVAN